MFNFDLITKSIKGKEVKHDRNSGKRNNSRGGGSRDEGNRSGRTATLLPRTDPIWKAARRRFFEACRRATQNRRLFILQPFALLLGILLYRSTIYEPSRIALLIGALFWLALLFFYRERPVLAPMLLLICGVWGGIVLLPLHGSLFGTEMLYGAIYGRYSAHVDKIHSNDSNRARIIISQITPLDGANLPPIRRARILLPSDQIPRVGDMIEAKMRLYRVPGPVTPGGFDSQFHAYFEGIGAFGSVTSNFKILSSGQHDSFAGWVQNVRDFIGVRIDMALDPPISGIARALIIGDQGQIDDKIRDQLASAGLAHVLAISGLHLSLVAGGVFAAIRLALAASYFVGQRLSVKKIAALGGMLAALLYLGLSGASVSAIRATLMLLLVFGAVLFGRRALTMRNVAIAAIFVIIMDPASIFRPSFQLSFAAVAALVGAYERYRPDLQIQTKLRNKWFSFAGSIALTSLIAGAATALFAAYHFQQVAPLGVLGNMFAIPLVSMIVLPFALLAVLLIPFGIDPFAFHVMGWGIEQIIFVAQNISAIGSNLFSAPILGPIALLIGLAGLAWFTFFPSRIRYLGVALAAICLPVFGTLPPPDVMIADSTQAVALRSPNGLELVAGRQGSFAVRVWSESFMEPILDPPLPKPCDGTGCFFQRQNFSVALVKTRDAFDEDCNGAQLVISRISAPASCARITQVIDKEDLKIRGVHWAKWTGDKFWIRPAVLDIYRPWRPQYPSLEFFEPKNF